MFLYEQMWRGRSNKIDYQYELDKSNRKDVACRLFERDEIGNIFPRECRARPICIFYGMQSNGGYLYRNSYCSVMKRKDLDDPYGLLAPGISEALGLSLFAMLDTYFISMSERRGPQPVCCDKCAQRPGYADYAEVSRSI